MKNPPRWIQVIGGVAIVVGAAFWLFHNGGKEITPVPDDDDEYGVTVKDYHPPAPRKDDILSDDKVEEKNPKFDPARVDRRPLGEWQVNASGAVVMLHTPMLKPDLDAKLLTLYPSYRAAVDAAKSSEPGTLILPSINMIDGKAKQFDDGLYAAIDTAYYKGLNKTLASHVGFIKRLYEKVGPDSPASAYLAAGLVFANVDVKPSDEKAKASYLFRFESDATRSKPLGFYTWNKTLADCFRFLRYFQGPIDPADTGLIKALVDAFKADPALLADYRKTLAFYAKLSNPTRDVSLADFVDGKTTIKDDQALSLFPESTSRETELFQKLFPLGLPPKADLIRELIAAIRSGKIDLKPKADSGWYDYQVHALESFLLPQNGEGSDHLLLTRQYKERMVEAFKALITKRRETHVRGGQKAASAPAMAPRPDKVGPRLRLEPSPAYYHRTARAYAFLGAFLESAIGADLKSLHGLKEGGEREPDLQAELASMRDLFYGFYLLSCEDIGHAPEFLEGETVDRPRAEKLATDWLSKPAQDADMAVDTRVSVPVYIDGRARKTRLWATLGIRLARLDVSYAKGPKIRHDKGEWTDVEPDELGMKRYLIAVDEFAEIELPRLDVLTRAQLREVCDTKKTKEAIITGLTTGK